MPETSSKRPLNDETALQRVKRPRIEEINPGSGSEKLSKPKKKHDEKGKKKPKRADKPGKPSSGKAEVDENVQAPRDFRRGTGSRARTETADGEGSQNPRLPKRQCALLIGYSGTGFNGMQFQAPPKTTDGSPTNSVEKPGVKTIEGVLFDTLVRVGAISEDNADDPVKVGLQRAARTDAGVHAAGNVVSLKMITVIPDLLTRINSELPPEIRLWGFLRAQNSFNARMSCDSRKYNYFFPSYLLIPPKPGSGLAQTFKQQTARSSPLRPFSLSEEPEAAGCSSHTSPPPNSSDSELHPFWRDCPLETDYKEDMARKKQWRVPIESMEKLRAMSRKYEGTHNFHNFTVGRDFKDRSCHRHMWKIEVEEPLVYDGTEWISVVFFGQSFMLHQIRKMICVLVLACRTGTPPSVIDELYGPRKVVTPKMPALGLLLEYPIFESYNTRVTEANGTLETTNVDYRPIIDFEIHREKIDSFKREFIYSRMRASEECSQIFDQWVRSIDRYAGPDLVYYNAKGNIPDAAVVKAGENRPNPLIEKRKFNATDFELQDAAALADQEDEDEVEDNIACED